MNHQDFSDMDDFDTQPTMLEAGAAFADRIASGAVCAPYQHKPATGRRDVPRDAARFDRCKKCGGSGRWMSFSGMSGGKCFACNGTGNGLSINPTAVKARERAATKKQEQANTLAQQIADFTAARADIVAWWNRNQNFEFAVSTRQALNKFGSLTPGQLAGIEKCLAKDAARQATRQAERDARCVSIAGEGFSKLLAHFQAARDSGLKNPALVFDGVCFKIAKKHPGSLYVTEGKAYGSTYYGRVDANGKFDPTRAVTPEKLAEIVAIGSDPIAQATAYGKRTGTCCCCGAELTNAISIEYGIGPICREKWGM